MMLLERTNMMNWLKKAIETVNTSNFVEKTDCNTEN